jgi:glycosyltransferase involved in cell wall biosynthesis
VGARSDVDELELVVADWDSDDWPLAEWLEEAAHPIPVRMLTLTGTFSRGRGLNTAADAARGEYLFFIDSDALVSGNVLQRGIRALQQGNAYFPVLYSFTDRQHSEGFWRHAGYGHCMISRQAFDSIGGWPEYTSWGREDDHFWTRVVQRMPVVREIANGFYHQWHPDDIDFKNRYGDEDEPIRKIRERAEQTALEGQVVERLRTILPRDTCYILVDDDRTDIKDHLKSRPIPFLERSGRYWGPPADDAQAISELKRLRREQAEFIVFPWLASWWLDHYKGFAEYLDNSARCVENDELLTVYDLHSAPGGSAGAIARLE